MSESAIRTSASASAVCVCLSRLPSAEYKRLPNTQSHSVLANGSEKLLLNWTGGFSLAVTAKTSYIYYWLIQIVLQ